MRQVLRDIKKQLERDGYDYDKLKSITFIMDDFLMCTGCHSRIDMDDDYCTVCGKKLFDR